MVLLTTEDKRKILDWVLNQGLAITLLVIVTIYAKKDIDALRIEVRDTQKQLINYLSNDRDTLFNQLQHNTELLDDVKKVLKSKR